LNVGGVAAQTNTGEIDGSVHDALGGAVPGAALTIRHVASGLLRERVSDAAGRFVFSELPVGEYALSVELAGFKKITERGIRLNVGQRLTVPIVREVGAVTDAITISAVAGLLNTANAERGDIIENRLVVQLRSQRPSIPAAGAARIRNCHSTRWYARRGAPLNSVGKRPH
jgi:hypothetical protein